jgi:ferredoxin
MDAACVSVCPVDCIHGDATSVQLYIDPEECIDCAACEPVCPVDAIFAAEEVPPAFVDALAINANFFAERQL